MKRKNIFWGVTFIIIAVTIVASITGLFAINSPVRIIWTGLLLAFALSNIVSLNFSGIIFPLAIAFHINAGSLFNYHGRIWPIYLAALFLSIGLSTLFKGTRRRFKYYRRGIHGKDNNYDSESDTFFSTTSENMTNNRVNISNSFGDASRYIHSDNFTSAAIENNFGNLRVYFDQTTFSQEGADIRVECNFGKITLYFPRSVNLQNNIGTTLGSVRGQQSFMNDSLQPTVFLTGEANFGDIEVILV